MLSAARLSGGSGPLALHLHHNVSPQGSPSGAGALPVHNNIVLQRHMELMHAYQRQLREEEAEQEEERLPQEQQAHQQDEQVRSARWRTITQHHQALKGRAQCRTMTAEPSRLADMYSTLR